MRWRRGHFTALSHSSPSRGLSPPPQWEGHGRSPCHRHHWTESQQCTQAQQAFETCSVHFHTSASKGSVSPPHSDSPSLTEFIQTGEENILGQGHLRSANYLSACQAQPLADICLSQLPLGCYLGCWLKLLGLVHLSPSVLPSTSCFLLNLG